MHLHFSDPYQERESPLHALDPRVKVLGALAYIAGCSLMPAGAWGGYLALLILLLSLVGAARLGWAFTLKRSFVALPFVLAALALPFTVAGETVIQLPVLGWQVSDAGVLRLTTVVLRSWLAVQGAILLTAITRFHEILWALGALGLPGTIVGTLGFMYRYLFVLGDEGLRLLRARSARSARLAGTKPPGVVWQAQVAGGMVGSLFLRSLERSERIYQAMLARGYDGTARRMDTIKAGTWQWVLLAAYAAALAALLALAHWV
jgi:cobalt/nickel transport system permease protein